VWNAGDVIELDLNMAAHLLAANPRVESTRGSVTVWYGPFVYCFEGIDNPEVDDLRDLTVRHRATIEATHEPSTLGGITTLQLAAAVAEPTRLYYPVNSEARTPRPVTGTAIPYYAWANRGPHPMTIWLNRA
jgi:DUF1680 family protein